MSGGKGGGQTSKVQIPSWVEGPASRNLQRAEQLAGMGYQPYYGPEVAAFNPMQIAGMQSAADAASAFGIAPQMNVASSIPQAQDFGGGLMGYGSGLGFEQAVREFQQRQPAQAALYNSQFAGPNAGGYPQAGSPMMAGMQNNSGGYTDISNLIGRGSSPYSGSAQTGYGGGGAGLAEGYGNVDQSGVYGGFGGGYFPAFPISQTAGGTVPVVGAAGGAEPSRTDWLIGGRSAEPIVPETARLPTGEPANQPALMFGNQGMMPSYNLGFGASNPYRAGM